MYFQLQSIPFEFKELIYYHCYDNESKTCLNFQIHRLFEEYMWFHHYEKHISHGWLCYYLKNMLLFFKKPFVNYEFHVQKHILHYLYIEYVFMPEILHNNDFKICLPLEKLLIKCYLLENESDWTKSNLLLETG